MAKKPNKLICVDFDGVLHDYKNPVPGRRMGGPFAGALEAIQELQDHGFEIIVQTVNNAKVVADWLDYYGFGNIPVTNEKPNAIIYIDDRAIRHEDWDLTMAAVEKITGFNE